jgi:ubiquinone/menaquinone biosynthesis C-methylase UbiE
LLVHSRLRSASVARYGERMAALVGPGTGTRLLDVGCGNGAATVRLARRFPVAVTGVDLDADQIRLARAAAAGWPEVRSLVADARRLPFVSDAFDLVWTNKTTHHIPLWQEAFQEMVRVLQPGGHLIDCDFAGPGWLGSLLHRLGGDDFGWPARRQLETLAAQVGPEAVHLNPRCLNYEAIWRKKGF